jgi:hypothetical protein
MRAQADLTLMIPDRPLSPFLQLKNTPKSPVTEGVGPGLPSMRIFVPPDSGQALRLQPSAPATGQQGVHAAVWLAGECLRMSPEGQQITGQDGRLIRRDRARAVR